MCKTTNTAITRSGRSTWGELAGIAKSVERYRARWIAGKWHKPKWIERQAARGRKSGEARRGRTGERDAEIVEAVLQGESMRTLAGVHGLSHFAVQNIVRRDSPLFVPNRGRPIGSTQRLMACEPTQIVGGWLVKLGVPPFMASTLKHSHRCALGIDEGGIEELVWGGFARVLGPRTSRLVMYHPHSCQSPWLRPAWSSLASKPSILVATVRLRASTFPRRASTLPSRASRFLILPSS